MIIYKFTRIILIIKLTKMENKNILSEWEKIILEEIERAEKEKGGQKDEQKNS